MTRRGTNHSRRRKTERREMATARNAARSERSDSHQLARLEANGHGHCAETRRLRGENPA